MKKGRYLFFFIVILGLILAEIFLLKRMANQLRTEAIVPTVIFEPVEIEREPIEEPDGELFSRTHDVVEIIDLSQEEERLLLQLGMAEGGNQDSEGIWLVMSVVVNRVKDPDWPNSIRDVITQQSQFSCVSNGTFYKVTPNNDCFIALKKLEAGKIAPQIVAFETTRSNELDAYFTEVFKYKNHKFYKKMRPCGA